MSKEDPFAEIQDAPKKAQEAHPTASNDPRRLEAITRLWHKLQRKPTANEITREMNRK